MSTKNIDLFIKHLEEFNMEKINPKALTYTEMVMLGKTRGFNFTIKELNEKIEEINNSPNEELGTIEKIWKGKGC